MDILIDVQFVENGNFKYLVHLVMILLFMISSSNSVCEMPEFKLAMLKQTSSVRG